MDVYPGAAYKSPDRGQHHHSDQETQVGMLDVVRGAIQITRPTPRGGSLSLTFSIAPPPDSKMRFSTSHTAFFIALAFNTSLGSAIWLGIIFYLHFFLAFRTSLNYTPANSYLT